MRLVPPEEKALTKEQDPLLYLLAEEWARLRQKAETERDPMKLVIIVDRLDAILSNAEHLLCLNDEESKQSRPDARPEDSLREKSGEGD